MGRFACEACVKRYGLSVVDLVVWACCEVCGADGGDWSPRWVTWAGGPRPDPAVMARRVVLLRRLAGLAGPGKT